MEKLSSDDFVNNGDISLLSMYQSIVSSFKVHYKYNRSFNEIEHCTRSVEHKITINNEIVLLLWSDLIAS